MRHIKIKAQFPEKLAFLFEPSTPEYMRYKILHGGRASMKSWSVARSLLIRGCNKKRRNKLGPNETKKSPIIFRVWCAREVQNSIEESVHQLLESQIRAMGLEAFYDVQKFKIIGKKNTSAEGTEFIFAGLYDVEQRKGLEDVDVMWLEEANKVSKFSWDVIIPTIRKEYDDGTCSEIIATFNPELEDDETYRRFVNVKNRPSNAHVIEVSYKDNPWLPKVIEVEIRTLKEQNYDDYLWIYGGKTRQALEGAIFAKELRDAKEKGRICQFSVERGHPVNTFWDLGRGDYTAIWFIQRVGLQWRVVDFYQNRLFHIDHYIGVLQTKAYVYGTHFLPHDGKAKQLGSKFTVEEQLRGDSDMDVDKTPRNVVVLPVHRIIDQHNALRTMFPNMYFEQDNCSEGLSLMGRYRYKIDPKTKQFSKEPEHDDASHAASALMQFAISANDYLKKLKRPAPLTQQYTLPSHIPIHPQGWLGQ